MNGLLPFLLAAFAFALAGVMQSNAAVLAMLAFGWLFFYFAYAMNSTFRRNASL
jgi:hypothetical protein